MTRSMKERSFACRVLKQEVYPDGVYIRQSGKPIIDVAEGDGYLGMDIRDVRDELSVVNAGLKHRVANIQRALLILDDLAAEAAKADRDSDEKK